MKTSRNSRYLEAGREDIRTLNAPSARARTLLKWAVRFSFKLWLAGLVLSESSTSAATRHWDGGGANGFWDTAANWSNNVAPANGDSVIFPTNALRLVNTNRTSPAAVSNLSSLTLRGDGYVFHSIPLNLANGITDAGPINSVNTIHAILQPRASQTWSVGAKTTLILHSNVVFNGATLTIDADGVLEANANLVGGAGANLTKLGSGRLELNGPANVLSQVRVGDGLLLVDGVLAANSLVISNGAILAGSGTVSAFTHAGQIRIGGNAGLGTGILTVTGPAPAVFLPGGNLQVHVVGTTPGLQHDQLRVAIAPNLANGSLTVVRDPAFPVSVGQKFVIVTNTGAATFTTTFTNLPQGARITNNLPPTTIFQISYTGGSGNDVELTVVEQLGARGIWDGGGTDGFWQSPANWQGDVAPVAGDPLHFGGSQRRVSTNTFPAGTLFHSLTFSDANAFTLFGNALRLGNGLTNQAAVFSQTLNLPVELASNQTWLIAGGLVVLTGPLSGGSGLRLTMDGPGALNLSGNLPNSFAGTLLVRGGRVDLQKRDGAPALAGPITLQATATAGAFLQVVAPGQFSNAPSINVVGNPASVRLSTLQLNQNSGTNRIGSLTLDGGLCNVRARAALELQADLNAAVATMENRLTVTFDSADAALPKLMVSGQVDIRNAKLGLSAPTAAPGEVLTVIRKDSAGPVTGTFENLPEGALLTNAPFVFQISYAGGDGNDVVLTVTSNVVFSGVTRLWDGGGTDGFWQSPTNWQGDMAPNAGDRLEFAGNQRRVTTNSLAAGTLLESITFSDTNAFTLSGNAVRLANGLSCLAVAFSHNVKLPLELTASQTWHLDGGLVIFTGPLSGGGGLTLTVDGAGALNLSGNLPNSFSGTLLARGGRVDLQKGDGAPALAGPIILQATATAGASLQVLAPGQFGNAPPVSVLGNASPVRLSTLQLSRNSKTNRLGPLTLNGGIGIVPEGAALEIQGDLHAAVGATENRLNVTYGASDATEPKLTVAGQVNIHNTKLSVNASASAPGVALTIIRKDSPGPVVGTFFNLPQGATLTNAPLVFQISYTGGDGNDVVLTELSSAPRPSLIIEHVPPASVRLLWSTNHPAFSLQFNTNLVLTNWAPASPAPVVVGSNHVVTNTVNDLQRFYRLFKP